MSTDRTESGRGTDPCITPAIQQLVRQIHSEYREMPCLSRTTSQAERLWGLDTTTCAFVLTTLLERRILRRTPKGVYLRGPAA